MGLKRPEEFGKFLHGEVVGLGALIKEQNVRME